MKLRNILIILGIVALGAFAFTYIDHASIVVPTPKQTVSSSPMVSLTPTATPKVVKSVLPTPTPVQNILLDVQFTSQAPFGDWRDPREQNGCEEASAVMAMHWVRGTNLTPTIALNEIIAISDYELATIGQFIDTSAEDTVNQIFKGYFKYTNVSVQYEITIKDMITELGKGHIVIIPVNGQKVGNPNYKQPGPLEHMILIKGYNVATNEFITNDPGTRKGESYRYPTYVLFNAIRDYVTGGNHQHEATTRKVMIIVSKLK